MTAAVKEVRSLSLYEISAEWDDLMSLLAENGGEVTPEIEARFNAINDAYESKVESAALFIRTQRSLALAAKNEADRLYALQKVRERSADSLERIVKGFMERKGQFKVVGNLARVALVNVGGKLAVTWDGGEPKDIPEQYRIERHKIEYSLDRELALQAYEAGHPLPAGITVHPRAKRLSIS